jgi:sulfopropanediol 3-dehydrogenase
MNESYATGLQDYARREIAEDVAAVTEAVRRRGDEAVRELTRRARGFAPAQSRLSDPEIAACIDSLSTPALDDIADAVLQIRAFAQAQRAGLRDCETGRTSGFVHGVRHVPVGSSATTVSWPADARMCSADLSAWLTSLTLAASAGVPRVVACVPPDGSTTQAWFVAAAQFAGTTEIHLLDGVPAIAALAIGTESVERVDVTVDCGGPLTAEATHQLFGGRGLDLARRPADLLVIADESADPHVLGAELATAVVRDAEARAVLVTASVELAQQVAVCVERELASRPPSEDACRRWDRQGAIHRTPDVAAACALADRYAFPHVRIVTDCPRCYLDQLHSCATASFGEEDAAGAGQSLGSPIPVRAASPRHHQALWIGHFMRSVAYREWVGEGSEEPSAAGGGLADQLLTALLAPIGA